MDLFQRIPNAENLILNVNECFYEKVYDHPWLGLYFKHIERDFISRQQTDFIVGAIGGPKNFSGRMPSNAHPHMFITDELFDVRKQLLTEALEELKAPEELKDTWLRIDESFRRVIVKNHPKECQPRFNQDEFLIFPKPGSKRAA